MKNYFLNGFSLANRSLDIYLIWLLLSLIILVPSFFGEFSIVKALQFLTIPLTLINFAFWFSIPFFLTNKQQNKPQNYNELRVVTLRNAKRLIIPAIVFMILFVVLAFLFIVIAATKSGGNPNQIAPAIQKMTQSLMRWNPLMFIFAGIFSLFTFTPIYFSIKNNGFFGSVKRSVMFSFKNLSFTAIVFLIYLIFYSIASLFPFSVEVPPSTIDQLNLLIRTVVGGYFIGFVVMASSLLYYKNKSRFVERV